MAWEKYRPTPGKNTTRYRNTETGETQSRRQYEKQTFSPIRYAQYYNKGIIESSTKTYDKFAKTRHKTYKVARAQDIEKVLKAKKPKDPNATAHVRIIDTKTGQIADTGPSAVTRGESYIKQLVEDAKKVYKGSGPIRLRIDPEEHDPDEFDDFDDFELDEDYQYEIVYVTDLPQ